MRDPKKHKDTTADDRPDRELTDKELSGVAGGAEAYCVKDKKKVEVLNPQRITMKNG